MDINLKKGNTYCCVPQCKNYNKEGLSFHTFPKNVCLRKRWETALKLDRPSSHFMRVCSEHFMKSDYFPGIPKIRRRLKSNAVPSNKLPATQHDKQLALDQQSCIIQHSKHAQRRSNYSASERMDPGLQALVKAIKDDVSENRLGGDDVALPVFDPSTSDLGAEYWCNNIETLAEEFGWDSITTVAKASKALKGSALLWFETWNPAEGRSWENLRTELVALYQEKTNLAEKLKKAVLYNSESVNTYCEYAREKIRLLRNTKIAFSESQLVELICGSISDVNVRLASFNSNVRTTSELIAWLKSHTKSKKRPLEQSGINSKDGSDFIYTKRTKIET